MSFALRLVQESSVVEFKANHANFRTAIMAAFNALSRQAHVRGAQLEVLHKNHGWVAVCSDGYYVSIRSPLHLDYIELRSGIMQTLQQADSWPTEAQKIAAKHEANKREMEEEAERRRNRFFIVSE